MTEATLRFGGVPTDMQVKKIRDRWPDADLNPGDAIPCEAVAEEIGVEIGSHRFRTVTGRWRKLVEKGPCNLVIAQRAGSFRVLKDGEVVNSNESDLRSAVRRTRRAAIRSVYVDVKNLSEDERKRYDIHAAMTGKLLAVAAMRKNGAELPKLE